MKILYNSFDHQATKVVFALAVFFLLSISAAYAQCPPVATSTQAMTWTGAVSTDWADACNWSPNGVPGPGNYVQISIGATNPILSTTATVRSVQLNNSKQLTVSSTGRLNLIGDGGNVSGINFYESSSLQNDGSIYIEALDGSTLTYTDIFYGSNSNGCSLTNNGFIRVNSTAYVIGLRTGNSITNNSCGRMTLLGGGNFSNPGVVTNYGLIETANSILQSGTFTNNGVLKYGSLTGTITNSGNGSVIVNNTPTPIFTYGGTYNGTINGIFSDATATISAGTFTAPNTFTPSGLPFGSQTLYAKITPSGGACSYVVPFDYVTCSNSPTLYVDASRAVSGNGETWATAYKTLDEALALAHCCTLVDTIKVATGTYKPTRKPYNGCTEMTTADPRDLTFHLPDGLVLWGGYPAGGGARNSTANITTLSGDFNGDDVVTGTGATLSITNNTENAYHVVLASAPTSGGIGVTIDGFSIIGGNANGSSFITVNGNNVARESGGAIITLKGTNALTNNLIYNNAAINGGGIYANGTNTITNNTISGNRAIGNSNIGGGGGIFTTGGTNNTLAYNTISGNRSGGAGGGGIYAAGMNSITNNTLLGNSVTFVANSGRGGGGGIYATFGTTTITNNTLSGNSAIHGDGSGGGGGGISIDQGTNTLTNNTLSGNSGNTGGGIFTKGGINTISNNILWGNQQGSSSTVAGADYHAMLPVTNNNIFTNNLLQLAASNYPTDASWPYGIGTAASGNIFAQDPLFVNAADIDGADDIHRTADDGLRLQIGSPCINTGNNTGVAATDITGAARIQATTVDMGAYEGGVNVCPTVPTLYVDAGIATSGNGQSWATAYKTLDEALALAHCCSIIDTIKVATGTYVPTKKPYNGCTEMTTANARDLTFHLPDGLVLWGGYPAGGGARNSTANITTLSGDFNGDDVVTGTGATLSITNNTENAYHVVLASAPTSGGIGVTIDGFSIIGGNANGSSFITVNGNNLARESGGAIITLRGTNALTNNLIYNNAAINGGGIYANGTNTITNNTISGNRAIGNSSSGGGGGIYANGTNNTLAYNTISGNRSGGEGGGGIYANGTNTITNNTLLGNSVTFVAYSGRGGGGGIYATYGTTTITNNTLSGNSAIHGDGSGGGGGGISIDQGTNTLTNNTLSGNSGNAGGGIFTNGGINTISNNILWGNQQGSSSTVAGADYHAMWVVTNNNIFTNNLLQLAASNYPTDASWPYGIGTAASGNIFAQDPLFVNTTDIDGADNIHRTADDGLRLKPCSSAINTGTNTGVATTDIAGTTRIQQTTVDMGAYENKDLAGYTLSTSVLNANAECTDAGGLTHYYNTTNDALILSIQKNGNTIGTIGDGTFTVTSGGAGVSNLGTAGTPAPYARTPNWYTMNRYWNVTPTTQPTSDVQLRFYYLPADYTDIQTASGITAETDMIFYKINGAGNPDPSTAHTGTAATPAAAYNATGYWEYYHNTTAGTANWASGAFGGHKYAEIVVAMFSGGGGGAGAGGGGALPVELLSFTGKNKGSYNHLEWRTASETNNTGFDVERSDDGTRFEKIGFVPSKGKEANTYTFKDEDLRKNIYYYRLKQIDTDQKYTYSNVVVVRTTTAPTISVAPNPSTGIFRIQGMPISDRAVVVSNALGQRVAVAIRENEIDLTDLPAGVYYLSVQDKSFKLVKN